MIPDLAKMITVVAPSGAVVRFGPLVSTGGPYVGFSATFELIPQMPGSDYERIMTEAIGFAFHAYQEKTKKET